MKKQIEIDVRAAKEIDTFSEDVKIKITALLDILSRDGFLKEPNGKRIDEDIFEIRIKHSGQFRVLYAYMVKSKVLVLSAFVKKTQKTPLKEIKKAKKRLIQHIKE